MQHPIEEAGPAELESFVYFRNTTTRHVNLLWTNYLGEQLLYFVLKPGDGCKMNTYGGHPWMFSDAHNGDKMHVMQKEVFWPEPYKIRNPSNPKEWITARRVVNIHFPLKTLRESCLWAVAAALNAKRVQPDKALDVITSLPLPITVMKDLHQVLWNFLDHL